MSLPVTDYASSATVVVPPDQWVLNGQSDENPYLAAYHVWVAVETINLVTDLRTAFEVEHNGTTGLHTNVHCTSIEVGGGYGSTGGTLDSNGALYLDGLLTVGGGYSVGGSGMLVNATGDLITNGAGTFEGAVSVGAGLGVTGDVTLDSAGELIWLRSDTWLVHLAGRLSQLDVTTAGAVATTSVSAGAAGIALTTSAGLFGAGGTGAAWLAFDGPGAAEHLEVSDTLTLAGATRFDLSAHVYVYAMDLRTGEIGATWSSGNLTGSGSGDLTLTCAAGDYTPSSTHRGHTFLMKVEFASEHATNNGSFTLRALEIPYTVTRITRG